MVDITKFNKGISYIDSKKYNKAISIFKTILREDEFKEAWLNLGVAYKCAGMYEKSRDALLHSCDPRVPLSDGTYTSLYDIGTTNLGLLAYTFEHDEEAKELYKVVLNKNPLNYDTIWNLSLASLRRYFSGKKEDLALCWEYYDYRFKRKGAEGLKNRKKDLLYWDFVSTGDSIVVLIEQGMGDAIMFGRYLSELEKYFDKIYIQCTPEMDYLFDKYNTCRDASETDAKYAVPTCSLGRLLKYIPDGDWLASKRIDTFSPKLRIGCVWQGSSTHLNDNNRSCSAGYFDKLAAYGTLYSINNERKGYINLKCNTWKDTIENLAEVDLVISVDTSIVHLCGALGKPCWVLMPLLDTDFRWGDSSIGYNNLCYDSVDVFRNPNDWEKVFMEVRKRLDASSK